MAISLASLKKSTRIDPPKILVYGINGIGKTTFASMSPNPVFILTEKGLGTLEVNHFPRSNTYAEVVEAVNSLLNEEHKFQTLVIDSVDWLEKLIHDHVAKDADKESVEDLGYGKGYTIAQEHWFDFVGLLDKLNEQKKMSIILVGHSLVKSFNSPETENYDRYRLDMHDKSASVVMDWCDVVLFANYKVYISTTTEGFNKKDHKGVGSGERVMYSEERPSFWAKNRYSLPFEMPFSWKSFADAMAKSCAPKKKPKVVEKTEDEIKPEVTEQKEEVETVRVSTLTSEGIVEQEIPIGPKIMVGIASDEQTKEALI